MTVATYHKGSNRLASRATRYIVQQIESGSLRPGQTIPPVRSISQALEISTTVTLEAIKGMREEGWIEQAENKRNLVSHNVRRLLAFSKGLKLGFACRGHDHIRVGTYQAIFNILSKQVPELGGTIDCLFDSPVETVPLPQGCYDAMIIADWAPKKFKMSCNGLCIGLDRIPKTKVDCYVATDHFCGGGKAARHLWEQGYRRAVYWDSTHRIPAHDMRLLGFQKEWVLCGGGLDDIQVMRIIDPLPNGCTWPRFCDTEKLVPYITERVKTADAFFVFCDMWALQFWQVLESQGVSVPHDIAIVGFDGSHQGRTHEPPLTSVKHNIDRIADAVIDAVVDNVVNRQTVQLADICIEPQLILGGSTKQKTANSGNNTYGE